MNYINPQDQNKLSCINCQAVTTNDGRTVWVCEQCGTENTAPQVTMPDALDAQAAISDAAVAAGIPMTDVTPPVAPVETIPEIPAVTAPEPYTPPVTVTQSVSEVPTVAPVAKPAPAASVIQPVTIVQDTV